MVRASKGNLDIFGHRYYVSCIGHMQSQEGKLVESNTAKKRFEHFVEAGHFGVTHFAKVSSMSKHENSMVSDPRSEGCHYTSH